SPLAELPLHFALILFPSFQALDVFGPLDALNTLKRLYPSLPLRLSILSATPDPVSTIPSSAGLPGPAFEQQIIPTHTFTSPPPEPIDILFIPGGFGTRLADTSSWKPVADYLNNFFANGTAVRNLRGVFTVCTGSLLLARSKALGGKGMLDGVRATTNKRGFKGALEELPSVSWEPHARWVRTDLAIPLSSGSEHSVKLWTTSGVSAGTDGIFAVISEEYGQPVADLIAVVLEYERRTDPDVDPFAVEL
ncbi:class I glutamine amidotransferase-like protein, partial [Macrolepiota fuliginosa MF-IS2]